MILFFCLIWLGQANAQHLKDDRYPNWDNKLTGKVIYKERTHKRYRSIRRQRGDAMRFLADAADVATLPIRRMAGAVVHGARPSGCPARSWCGCYLSKALGLHRRDLWLARNWARIGSPTGASPGAIVVWPHHVGRITAVDGNRIKVLSGNDSRMVRERWRSMAGVIAFRRI